MNFQAQKMAALERIEQASDNSTSAASVHHKAIIARLDRNHSLLMEAKAIDATKASTIEDKISEILSGVEKLASQGDKTQPPVREVNADASIEHDSEKSANLPTVSEQDLSVLQSIQRLGQLVRQKERTFDTFYSDNDECDSIIEDLNTILSAAKQRLKNMLKDAETEDDKRKYENISCFLMKFSKAHGSSTVTLNPKGQPVSH